MPWCILYVQQQRKRINMSTQLRNVPNLDTTTELTQTRFWGGQDRKQCLQVTQRKARGWTEPTTSDGFFNHIDLTRE